MKNLRLLLLGLAIALALVIGGRFFYEGQRQTNAVIAAVPQAPLVPDVSAEAKAQVLREIGRAPDYVRFFDLLKLAFPTEYDTIVTALANKSSDNGAANIDLYMSDAVRALRQTRGVLATKAEAEPLSQIFNLQIKILDALAEKDPKLCVDFLYGGASEAFHQFAAQNRPLVADMAVAGLEAMVNGQAKKIERTAPTEADFQLLEKALQAKNLSKEEIDALLDGKTPEPPIPDTKMCAAGKIYLETLRELPTDARQRIHALAVELMTRS